MGGYDDLIHKMERDRRASVDAVCAECVRAGKPEEAAKLRATMRKIEDGTYGAGSTWQSISEAQRRVLRAMYPSHKIARVYKKRTSKAYAIPGRITGVHLSTIRNLGARGLIDWEGGAFDPEAAAVLSDQGRFVVHLGPQQERI